MIEICKYYVLFFCLTSVVEYCGSPFDQDCKFPQRQLKNAQKWSHVNIKIRNTVDIHQSCSARRLVNIQRATTDASFF